MAGFLMIPRDQLDPQLWGGAERHSRREAWIDLVALAAWKETQITSRGHLVTLQRGQVLASVRYLSSRWRWDSHTVRNFLSSIPPTLLRTVGPTPAGTIYEIVGYGVTAGEASLTSHTKSDTESTSDSHTKSHSKSHKTNKIRSEEVSPSETPRAPSWPARAAEIMNGATGGVASIPKLGKLLSPIVKAKGGFEHIEQAWSRFCSSPEVQYGAGYFAEHYGRYNGGAPQLDRKASEARDAQLNRDPRVQAYVAQKRENAELGWWSAMQKEAQAAGRWVVPYVYDKLTGGSSAKS